MESVHQIDPQLKLKMLCFGLICFDWLQISFFFFCFNFNVFQFEVYSDFPRHTASCALKGIYINDRKSYLSDNGTASFALAFLTSSQFVKEVGNLAREQRLVLELLHNE